MTFNNEENDMRLSLLSVRGVLIIGAVAALATAALMLVILTPRKAGADSPPVTVLDGFTVNQVRFDESTGEKKPTPVIPKSWRFVGVSNDEAVNTNRLWFQDAEGNIYMVRCYSGSNFGQFVLKQQISRIEGGK